MSGHTTGRVMAGVSKFQGREVFTAVASDNAQKIVALLGFCGADDEAESIANARRLVACWNACEGIDTYALELMTGDLSISNQITAIASRKPKGKKTAYRTQRDELLAALKAMLTHMGMDEDEWNKPTFDQARAAIAKVEQP